VESTAFRANLYKLHQHHLSPDRIAAVTGNPSKRCLSCHDGTVAPGQTVAYGKINTAGQMVLTSRFGADLRSSHPFSMKTPLTDAPELSVLLTGGIPDDG
jgi:hypothetical protein